MSNVYLGYVPLIRDTKAPKYPWKTKVELGTLEDYIHADWDDCSAVISDDYVVLDFDDERSCEIANKIVDDKGLNCYRNHSNHHLIFRKPKSFKFTDKREIAKYLACGIKCDILVSQNGKYSLECIKKNGVTRLVEVFNKDIDELPPYFYPIITKSDLGNTINFIDQNEGRYNDLFKYRLTLWNQRFDQETVKQILDIIIDYVMASEPPFKNNNYQRLMDFSQITRNIKTNPYIIWDEDNKGRLSKRFLARTFVIDTIEKYQIKLFDNTPMGFLNGRWIPFEKYIFTVLSELLGDDETMNIKSLVKEHFQAIITSMSFDKEKVKWNNARYMVFNNGTYDWVTNKLIPTVAEHYQTVTCDFDYIENPESVAYDKVIATAFGEDKEQLKAILQTGGSGFYKNADYKKMFHIFYGKGNNAKSLFTQAWIEIAGHKNCSTRSIYQICNDRFSMGVIHGKLFNIIDDANADYIGDTGNLKMVATGGYTDIENKGQDAKSTDQLPFCTIIANTNKIIRIGNGDDSFAIDKRRHVVHWTHQFLETDPDFDKHANTKLLNDITFLQKLLYESIQAFRDLLNSGEKFTTPKSSMDIVKQFRELMNQQEEQLSTYPIDTWVQFDINETYEKYKSLCGSKYAKNISGMRLLLLEMYPNLRYDEEFNAFYDITQPHGCMNWKLCKKVFNITDNNKWLDMIHEKYGLIREQARKGSSRPYVLKYDNERKQYLDALEK